MNAKHSPCPICRGEHPPRPLSFDGKGINSCDLYRSRLATFSVSPGHEAAQRLGPMFAAAPDMLAALKAATADINRCRNGDILDLHVPHEIAKQMLDAIAKAEGR